MPDNTHVQVPDTLPEFSTLIALARNDVASVDFNDVRMAYARLPRREPSSMAGDHRELRDALARQDWATASARCNALLEGDFLQVELHCMMSMIYSQSGKTEESIWHARFAQGLLNALFKTGNGESFATAYKLVTPREEYDVLRAFGAEMTGREQITHDGIVYDVLTVRFPDIESAQKLYFDLSAVAPSRRG